jgi:WD40 repeat protein
VKLWDAKSGRVVLLQVFRLTSDKVVKIQLHTMHQWLITADADDRVSVWDWEHRQVPIASFSAHLIIWYRARAHLASEFVGQA